MNCGIEFRVTDHNEQHRNLPDTSTAATTTQNQAPIPLQNGAVVQAVWGDVRAKVDRIASAVTVQGADAKKRSDMLLKAVTDNHKDLTGLTKSHEAQGTEIVGLLSDILQVLKEQQKTMEETAKATAGLVAAVKDWHTMQIAGAYPNKQNLSLTSAREPCEVMTKKKEFTYNAQTEVNPPKRSWRGRKPQVTLYMPQNSKGVPRKLHSDLNEHDQFKKHIDFQRAFWGSGPRSATKVGVIVHYAVTGRLTDDDKLTKQIEEVANLHEKYMLLVIVSASQPHKAAKITQSADFPPTCDLVVSGARESKLNKNQVTRFLNLRDMLFRLLA